MSKEEIITNDIKVPNKDLEALRLHFPHCFDKDGKFDIVKFQQQLNTQNLELTTEKESYGIDWLGKSYARLLASDPATTLLKADETHNSQLNTKNSENLLIKGDNLEVLKHLANAYYEKIKMIYIDPPYNTGSDGFVYNDDRKFTVKELQNLIGVDAEKAKRILDFTQSKSNSHSAWLTFMYPRLYIAKQLLKDDGVIFVSIDDNEVAQLRLLMDEVFGEENFIGLIVIETANGVFGTRATGLSTTLVKTKDYVVVYAKTNAEKNFQSLYMPTNDRYDPHYSIMLDENLNRKSFLDYINNTQKIKNYFDKFKLNVSLSNISKLMQIDSDFNNLILNELSEMIYQDVDFSLKVPEETERQINDGKIVKYNDYIVFKTNNGNGKIRHLVSFKQSLNLTDDYLPEYRRAVAIGDLWEGFDNDMKNVIKETNVPFESPKPTRLIKQLAKWSNTKQTDIILDFFAGSGTTGDAVMQLNAEDGGNRKFILVQLPEPIDPKKNKTAYDFVESLVLSRESFVNDNELNTKNSALKTNITIFEITKERLLRAAKKIDEELDEKTKNLKLKIKDLEGQLQTEETRQEIANLREQITQNSNLKTQNYFKIFETTPIWEDYNFEAEQFDTSQTLFDAGKLTEEDLKALLVTWKTNDNISLSQDLESVDLGGYTAFYGNGKLYLLHKNFTTENLKAVLEKIDTDKTFNPTSIIAFGYHFESKSLRELSENVKQYANKKKIDIDFVTRY